MLEELQALLRDEIEDPALAGVRVTALVLSVDYKNARVHFALASEADRRAAERALARASGFLRRRVGEAVDIKRVPDLRFIYDPVALL
jgi:ribosome-binding factor A